MVLLQARFIGEIGHIDSLSQTSCATTDAIEGSGFVVRTNFIY